jgi:ABC-type Fe3+ transport system permease subunit
LGAFRTLPADPVAGPAIAASAVLGALAATLALTLASRGRLVDHRPAGSGRLVEALRLLPPLVLALGIGMLPSLLRLAAGPAGPVAGAIGGPARVVADWLDPYLTPGVALVLALAAGRLPLAAAGVSEARRRWRPEYGDAAASLGASRGRWIRGLAVPRIAPALAGSWALVAALAATDVPAALLLAPSSALRPAGPTLLSLLDLPGAGPTAAALALAMLATNLAAFATAALVRLPADGLGD